MALSTVSGILTRLGLGRLGRLGLEQPVRYERFAPGELAPHRRQTARPDRRRRRQARPPQPAPAATTTRPAPTPRASAAATSAGSTSTSASTTTAGSPTPKCCPTKSRRPRSASCAAPSPSTDATASRSSDCSPTTAPPTSPAIHALACRRLGIRHSRTRPYRPQTNGKAERFIRTLLAGWAYGAIYRSSPNAPPPLTAGSGTTTIDADTQPSATNPRSAEPTCSGPTPRRVWRNVARPRGPTAQLDVANPPKTTKAASRRPSKKFGGDLLSREVALRVPSARAGLTSLFGMGRGVSPPL